MGACYSKGLNESRLLRKVFQAHATPGGGITSKGLMTLCAQVNDFPMESELANAMVTSHGKVGSNGEDGVISFDDFVTMLFTSEAAQFHVEKLEVLEKAEDLTQPLSHYFINSSHNTYLKGAQFASLGGAASLEQYATVVQHGCRCVELDCYNGDPDSKEPNEPLIYHISESLTGGALKVADVFSAIKRALPKGHLPLVLNCENHMEKKSLDRFVSLAKSTFGSSLLNFNDMKAKSATGTLPSPEQLRGKVLLRLKPKEDPGLEKITAFRNSKLKHIQNGKQEPYESISLSAPKLKKLVKVTEVMESERRSEVSSSSKSSDESSDDELDFDDVVGAYRYTSKYVTRAYPKATNVLSENFDPLRAWELGVELAALNWQTPGLAMDLNNALFLRNRGVGFVLKPKWMRLGADDPAPEPEDKCTVTITCIAARPTKGFRKQRFQEKFLDLYVRATMHEPFSRIDKHTRKKTKAIYDNNRPIWDQEVSVHCDFAGLAFIRLELMDKDVASQDDLVASYAVWLPALAPGLRMIPMNNTDGTHCYTLLAFVEIKGESGPQGSISSQPGNLNVSFLKHDTSFGRRLSEPFSQLQQVGIAGPTTGSSSFLKRKPGEPKK
mmetsp:Transcript_8340/g.20361  ORF Transcript_8340/g.20361 Transcript_8340/m.20361 type:complete len:611 (+) Transcript_8340:70-1902(+)